jgi:1-acyl-sn-glycerol-3-phosphate acyltransferase
MIYAILRPIAWLLMKVLFFHKATGVENIPTDGGCLFTCNHISLMDPVFLAIAVKKRKVHYMAKAELFRNKLFALFVRSLGAFPVKRGAKDISAIKNAIVMLEQGHHVGIFPPGKRVKGEKISRFKPGFVLLAARSECPIVPVYVKTKNQRIRLFRPIHVVFGKPLTVRELGYTDGSTENLHAVAQRLMGITEELAGTV